MECRVLQKTGVGTGLFTLIKVLSTSAYLEKLSHLSYVTCHLRVSGLDLPVEAGGFFVLRRPGPVDSGQEPLRQRGRDNYIQLTAVDEDLCA